MLLIQPVFVLALGMGCQPYVGKDDHNVRRDGTQDSTRRMTIQMIFYTFVLVLTPTAGFIDTASLQFCRSLLSRHMEERIGRYTITARVPGENALAVTYVPLESPYTVKEGAPVCSQPDVSDSFSVSR